MRTEHLVALLAARVEPVDVRQVRRRLLVSWAAGMMVSVLLLAAVLRFNSELPRETLIGMFWVRAGYCASLALLALVAVGRLGRPGARLSLVPLGLALPVIGMWLLAIVVLFHAPARDRVALILGHTALACPWLITLLAAPLLDLGFAGSRADAVAAGRCGGGLRRRRRRRARLYLALPRAGASVLRHLVSFGYAHSCGAGRLSRPATVALVDRGAPAGASRRARGEKNRFTD